MLYLIIGVLAVRAAVMAAPLLARRDDDRRLRELDRFWAARRLTTSWAGAPLVDGRAGEA